MCVTSRKPASLKSTAMETCTVCVLILAGFLSIETCESSSCFSGTRAVTWTLYQQDRQMTWNEASRFCKERGGYLPVTNTHITMAALANISSSWESITDVILIGLYNPVQGEIPNVWEADCCRLPPGLDYWRPVGVEPNDLDTQRCCRYVISRDGWRTALCDKTRLAVCETNRGNCTYETLHDTTITTHPNVSKAHVDDVTKCWSLCLELRHNGEECVAAVLEKTTSCKLYVERRLLDENEVQTSPCPGSVVMLRRCFEAVVSQENFPSFNYTDVSLEPNPWSVTCPDEYNVGIDPPDFLPPGVQPGLVDTGTCLSATADTAAPETTTTPSASTTLSSSASEGDMMTSSSLPLSVTSVNSAEPSSPETTVVTATTAAPSASTTLSFSTQPTSTSEVDTMTSSPPSSATSVNSAEPSSPETTVVTTTKDVATTDTKPTPCPCPCPNNSSSTSQHPVNQTVIARNHYSVNLTVIAKNQTSKYRRAKTSVWTGQTSDAIVGTPWVVACVFVFCCIVLCDLNPRKCLQGKNVAARKTRVAPKP